MVWRILITCQYDTSTCVTILTYLGDWAGTCIYLKLITIIITYLAATVWLTFVPNLARHCGHFQLFLWQLKPASYLRAVGPRLCVIMATTTGFLSQTPKARNSPYTESSYLWFCRNIYTFYSGDCVVINERCHTRRWLFCKLQSLFFRQSCFTVRHDSISQVMISFSLFYFVSNVI